MIYYPGDLQFVDVLTYASTRREYVDFYLADTPDEHPYRAFVEKLTGGGEELQVILTNGESLVKGQIRKIDAWFPEGNNGAEALSCLCQ